MKLPRNIGQLYQLSEYYSGLVLLAFGWVLAKVFWHPLRKAGLALWREAGLVLRLVVHKVVSFIVAKALWALTIAFALYWAANGFSVTQTFSLEGLEVVVRMLR